MNWIDGDLVDSDKHADSFDPATGERIGSYADASRSDVEQAVQAAVRAFESSDWKDNRRLRSKVLHQFADRFEARREDLIRILSLENGKVRNEAAFEVEEAIAGGAKVILRGGPVTEGPLAKGAFYRPTLLEVTDPKLKIVQEEVFGPVLTLQLFDTEAEAVRLANDSEYGLAASIWTQDIDRPLRVAREIDAGTIWINDWAVVLDEFEGGGFKRSGNGRLDGLAAMDEFLEYKHIAFNSGTITSKESENGR
jgi:acyl-CoA reductase-like NAD-dependent aldehyde dehydrogenase